MIVRELEKQERKYALDIIWSVFCMDVAEVYEQEGIDTFREYLKQENIDQLCDSGELLMFGVFEQEELEGTISFRGGDTFVIIMCADPAREKVLEGYFLTMRKGIVRKNCIRLL